MRERKYLVYRDETRHSKGLSAPAGKRAGDLGAPPPGLKCRRQAPADTKTTPLLRERGGFHQRAQALLALYLAMASVSMGPTLNRSPVMP